MYPPTGYPAALPPDVVAGQARHRISVGSPRLLAHKAYSPIAQGLSGPSSVAPFGPRSHSLLAHKAYSPIAQGLSGPSSVAPFGPRSHSLFPDSTRIGSAVPKTWSQPARHVVNHSCQTIGELLDNIWRFVEADEEIPDFNPRRPSVNDYRRLALWSCFS